MRLSVLIIVVLTQTFALIAAQSNEGTGSDANGSLHGFADLPECAVSVEKNGKLVQTADIA